MDHMGVLQPLAPLTEVLDNNPVMPSGAALFVSATVMLLDFSRPKWTPVTSKGKDWVLKCLKMCAQLVVFTCLSTQSTCEWLTHNAPTGAKPLQPPCAMESRTDSKVWNLNAAVLQRPQGSLVPHGGFRAHVAQKGEPIWCGGVFHRGRPTHPTIRQLQRVQALCPGADCSKVLPAVF